jgi:hypothetical protein
LSTGKRIHIALGVENVAASVADYSERLGAPPFVHVPDEYALSRMWADLVNSTATFNPLVLAPGQSGVIHLYIQPDPDKIGKTVSGDVFIDTFNYVQWNGDEVARLPYLYRVVK